MHCNAVIIILIISRIIMKQRSRLFICEITPVHGPWCEIKHIYVYIGICGQGLEMFLHRKYILFVALCNLIRKALFEKLV